MPLRGQIASINGPAIRAPAGGPGPNDRTTIAGDTRITIAGDTRIIQ